MNKFFPLPIPVHRNLSFLILAALLGASLTLVYFTSAYARQYDSPASARKLDAAHPISFMLPAYATEYFYFSLPNTEGSIPTIVMSNSSKIHIQLFDSRERALKYAISSSHVITFRDSLSKGEHYFLKLSNRSSQDKKLKIVLRYTEKAKEAAGAKKTTKAKNSVKTKPSTKPKISTKAKTSAKVKPVSNSKSTTNSQTSTKPITSANAKNSTKNSDDTTIYTPKPTMIVTPTPKAIITPTQIPKKSTNQAITDPNSKSNFLLSTHFLRIKAGTSLAIAEALNLSEESSSLSYQCIFSDKISIQNGILYSRSPGIAVIEIAGDNFKSSCTICIQ